MIEVHVRVPEIDIPKGFVPSPHHPEVQDGLREELIALTQKYGMAAPLLALLDMIGFAVVSKSPLKAFDDPLDCRLIQTMRGAQWRETATRLEPIH